MRLLLTIFLGLSAFVVHRGLASISVPIPREYHEAKTAYIKEVYQSFFESIAYKLNVTFSPSHKWINNGYHQYNPLYLNDTTFNQTHSNQSLRFSEAKMKKLHEMFFEIYMTLTQSADENGQLTMPINFDKIKYLCQQVVGTVFRIGPVYDTIDSNETESIPRSTLAAHVDTSFTKPRETSFLFDPSEYFPYQDLFDFRYFMNGANNTGDYPSFPSYYHPEVYYAPYLRQYNRAIGLKTPSMSIFQFAVWYLLKFPAERILVHYPYSSRISLRLTMTRYDFYELPRHPIKWGYFTNHPDNYPIKWPEPPNNMTEDSQARLEYETEALKSMCNALYFKAGVWVFDWRNSYGSQLRLCADLKKDDFLRRGFNRTALYEDQDQLLGSKNGTRTLQVLVLEFFVELMESYDENGTLVAPFKIEQLKSLTIQIIEEAYRSRLLVPVDLDALFGQYDRNWQRVKDYVKEQSSNYNNQSSFSGTDWNVTVNNDNNTLNETYSLDNLLYYNGSDINGTYLNTTVNNTSDEWYRNYDEDYYHNIYATSRPFNQSTLNETYSNDTAQNITTDEWYRYLNYDDYRRYLFNQSALNETYSNDTAQNITTDQYPIEYYPDDKERFPEYYPPYGRDNIPSKPDSLQFMSPNSLTKPKPKFDGPENIEGTEKLEQGTYENQLPE